MKASANFSVLVAPLESFIENVSNLEKLRIVQFDESIRQELLAIENLKKVRTRRWFLF
jgi:hypothetical protein